MCCYHQVVGDNLERIVEVLALAASRADVVLVDRGPRARRRTTSRGMPSRVAMGVGMVRHPEIEAFLHERFAGFGRGEMPENNLRQADVPEGARYDHARAGVGARADRRARGRRADLRGARASRRDGRDDGGHDPARAACGSRGAASCARASCAAPGIGESRVAEIVADLFEASTNPSVAYLASAGEVKVRLTAKARDARGGRGADRPARAEVRARLGDVVFTDEDETLEAGGGPAPAGRGRDARVRGVAHRRQRRGAAHRRPGGLRVLPGFGGRRTRPRRSTLVLGVSLRRRSTGRGSSAPSARWRWRRARAACSDADIGLALTGAAGPEPHGGAAPGHGLARAGRRRGPARARLPRHWGARPRPPVGRAGSARPGAPPPRGRRAARRRPRDLAPDGRRRRRPDAAVRRGRGLRRSPTRDRRRGRAVAGRLPARAAGSPAEDRHVTLMFLGDVAPAIALDVEERLLGAARATAGFATTPRRGRRRSPPPRAPGWCGWAWTTRTGRGRRWLPRSDAALSISRHARAGPFVPHITLARSARPIGLPRALATAAEPRVAFAVEGLTLFRSHPDRAAPSLRAARRFELGPAP